MHVEGKTTLIRVYKYICSYAKAIFQCINAFTTSQTRLLIHTQKKKNYKFINAFYSYLNFLVLKQSHLFTRKNNFTPLYNIPTFITIT